MFEQLLMRAQSFLTLLQFSDGLFPAGGYAHSCGLETYVQERMIDEPKGVEQFLRAYLEGSVGPCDAAAVVVAVKLARRRRFEDCLQLDEAVDAMKTASELREASHQIGRQTLRVACG